jgi:hypothetical protein
MAATAKLQEAELAAGTAEQAAAALEEADKPKALLKDLRPILVSLTPLSADVLEAAAQGKSAPQQHSRKRGRSNRKKQQGQQRQPSGAGSAAAEVERSGTAAAALEEADKPKALLRTVTVALGVPSGA